MNECETNNGGCDHTCVNEEGSFKCICNDGFKLGNDKKTCEGSIRFSSFLTFLVTHDMLSAVGLFDKCGNR